jgi:hypothetical protein
MAILDGAKLANSLILKAFHSSLGSANDFKDIVRKSPAKRLVSPIFLQNECLNLELDRTRGACAFAPSARQNGAMGRHRRGGSVRYRNKEADVICSA